MSYLALAKQALARLEIQRIEDAEVPGPGPRGQSSDPAPSSSTWVLPTDRRRAAADPELAAALAQIEAEIRSGKIGSGPILVRGKPLADWLPLDEVARWLRRAKA